MRALDIAAMQMRKGEVAVITAGPSFDWQGESRTPGGVVLEPGTEVELQMEMIDFVRDPQPWEVEEGDMLEVRGREREGVAMVVRGGGRCDKENVECP